MRLLQSLDVDCGSCTRRIELLLGDLSRMPPQHKVDVLVVSAFQNDYVPTSSSLIGALDRSGLSVAALANDKQIDLRNQFACWLSKPIAHFPFRHILCLESGWRGSPPQIADDLFRAMAPYLLTDFPNNSVAMPILGAGDQGFDTETMVKSILDSTVAWMQRGLPLRLLKIVAFSSVQAARAETIFAATRNRVAFEKLPSASPNSKKASISHDIFLSYSHLDGEIMSFIADKLGENENLHTFVDKSALREGGVWAWELANALD